MQNTKILIREREISKLCHCDFSINHYIQAYVLSSQDFCSEECHVNNLKTFASEISKIWPHYVFHLFRYEDAVELLLKHGARVDVEARMCWPGPHQHNCEERSKNVRKGLDIVYPSSDKLQCAIYYAIDGDQVRE